MLEKKEIERLAVALSLDKIDSIKSVHGGDINEAYRIASGAKSYFLKRNTNSHLVGLFEAEAKGLETLRSANSLRIPELISHFTVGQTAYLLLEFIEAGSFSPPFWQELAQGLAKLHRVNENNFGLEHDNYIGSLKQSNKMTSTWHEFFISQRIEPMLKLAVDNAQIHKSDLPLFERLFALLNDFFPEEKASLLHGDLWSGNMMASASGEACIYDPAIYYGHREMDIAMTKLFGGFDQSFYDFYNEFYPLEKGWEKRVNIANLYPLLVHVNLFGGSYYQQVKATIKAYC